MRLYERYDMTIDAKGRVHHDRSCPWLRVQVKLALLAIVLLAIACFLLFCGAKTHAIVMASADGRCARSFYLEVCQDAAVAQPVQQGPRKAPVGGSNPPGGSIVTREPSCRIAAYVVGKRTRYMVTTSVVEQAGKVSTVVEPGTVEVGFRSWDQAWRYCKEFQQGYFRRRPVTVDQLKEEQR